MSADEFIEQYGPMEMLKMQQLEEKDLGGGATMTTMGYGKREGSANYRKTLKSPKGMGDMKAMMKEQMANIKVYSGDPVVDHRGD